MQKGMCVFLLNVGDLLLVLRIDTGASLIQRHNAEPKYKDMPDAGFKDRCSDRLNAGLPCRIIMVESLGSSSCLLFEVKSANFSFISSLSTIFFQVQRGSVVRANISINATMSR